MSHGVTDTASAMFQSANSSNTGRKLTHIVGVTNTVRYKDLIQLEDTAKKLCKTRTFISTSHKWFTLGVTLELPHNYLHSSYRFLELVYIALVTGCVEGVRPTPPSYQNLKVCPKCAEWLKAAQRMFW